MEQKDEATDSVFQAPKDIPPDNMETLYAPSDPQGPEDIPSAINRNVGRTNHTIQKASKEDRPDLGISQNPTGLSRSHTTEAKDNLKVPTAFSPPTPNPHTCSECDKTFSHRPTLMKHQKTHTAKKHYECEECRKRFTRRSDLKIHQRTHVGERPYACPKCGERFSVSCAFLTHQQIHASGPEKSNHCLECGKSFGDAAALGWHQKCHLGEKPHKCVDCGKGFAWSSHLERHRRIHTGEKPYKCPECGRAFAWSSHLDRHMRIHAVSALPEEAPPSKCADCGKRANHITHPHRFKHKSTQTPLDHKDVEVTEEEEEEAGKQLIHQCMEGRKSFSQNADLLEHWHGEKTSQSSEQFGWCSVLLKHQHNEDCPSSSPKQACSFQDSAALAKHKLSHTSRPPHQSPDGDKSFGWSSCLQKLQRSHIGESPHACGDSGRGLAMGSHSERHRPNHARPHPCSCGDCGKAFSLEATLATHQCVPQVSGRKPHRCPECGKGFSTSAVLERHHRLHRSEKPYQCSACGKGFAWRSHFVRHQLAHTGEKPFPCAYCGKRFGRSSHCNRHQRAHVSAKCEGKPQNGREDALHPAAAPSGWQEGGTGGRRPLLREPDVWPLNPTGTFPWATKPEDMWRPMGENSLGQGSESSAGPHEGWIQPQVPPTSLS